MRGDRLARKARDLVGLGDIDAVKADLALVGLGDLGGSRLKSGFVAVGERKIRPACGEFDRQRPADAARRTRDGHGGSRDRGHLVVQF